MRSRDLLFSFLRRFCRVIPRHQRAHGVCSRGEARIDVLGSRHHSQRGAAPRQRSTTNPIPVTENDRLSSFRRLAPEGQAWWWSSSSSWSRRAAGVCVSDAITIPRPCRCTRGRPSPPTPDVVVAVVVSLVSVVVVLPLLPRAARPRGREQGQWHDRERAFVFLFIFSVSPFAGRPTRSAASYFRIVVVR